MTTRLPKAWPLALLAFGLTLAFFVQWLGARAAGATPVTAPLNTLLPRELPGWQVSDHPLAESEEERSTVSETLNYNDAIFRLYRRGSEAFAVYFAHWNPGRMSPRLIAAHTPDVCWMGAGWEDRPELEKRAGVGAYTEAETVALLEARAGLMAGQFRVFKNKNNVQNLLWWHIYGGEIYNYDTHFAAPWYAMFTDLLNHGLNQRSEQWFVRIGSTEPYSALWSDPGFQQVIRQLADDCLRQPAGKL
jgi:hypothetical protein